MQTVATKSSQNPSRSHEGNIRVNATYLSYSKNTKWNKTPYIYFDLYISFVLCMHSTATHSIYDREVSS